MKLLQIVLPLLLISISSSFSSKLELSSFGKRLLSRIRRNKREILKELCPRIGCQNGVCKEVNKKITCECDKNWTGSMCQIPCPRDCGPGGVCVVVDGLPQCACSSFSPNCNAIKDRSTPSIIAIKPLEAVITKPINVAEITENKIKYVPSDCSDVGFMCLNGGTCFKHISVADNKLRGVHCQCPKGFNGDLCQTRCSLRCQNQGTCHKDRASGKQMCLCTWEFKGKHCGERNNLFDVMKNL
ncbi:hypothetical protein FSP39_002525 [Pinctada imbricata]|uniref:EGF-like domain-containing protein n=1 Tax=Pinctada imbricata TaxID=66713 RepID=A0AA89BNC8_PINIB|nr:hypothetical protein FSP39_002525 [Pinctada imbricata]